MYDEQTWVQTLSDIPQTQLNLKLAPKVTTIIQSKTNPQPTGAESKTRRQPFISTIKA